jgi:hypothetical protein
MTRREPHPRAVATRPDRVLPRRPDLPRGPTRYTKRVIPATYWLRPLDKITAGVIARLRREQQDPPS